MQNPAEWQDDIIIINDNLKLHSVSDLFIEPLYELVERNKAYLQQAMEWPQSVVSVNDIRRTVQGNYQLHHRGYASMFMILRDDVLCGVISFNQIEPTTKAAYIGYWLDEALQGQGIVSRALQGMMRYYVEKGSVRRFVIKCIVTNHASNQVALRNGFTLEGCLKEAEFLNGKFHDQNLYARIIDK
ncbi:50S ribosomal protein L7/L12-serine acetyltransferase [Atlantibacter hermannii]|uniref:50S ribosomal protein L7/L12-serine acetyltransferase n=1 Tax=Atlantibacter hermannii TaxID=565 RepID=UPI001C6FEB64|nr:50S ribosomal protein L7/L12-serine acetyltransferase [Atlantibacter hermannii]MBW9431835.1 50S ribosomal protein L7/L12-serine acetyltransferase [Atlantibacter hermannii]